MGKVWSLRELCEVSDADWARHLAEREAIAKRDRRPKRVRYSEIKASDFDAFLKAPGTSAPRNGDS